MTAVAVEVAVAPAVAAKFLTVGGARVIGATAGGIANAANSYFTGDATDPTTGNVNRSTLFWNFASGFGGTRVGQMIPNPRGAPPITFGGSLAGARASTEQIRAQLGQLIQALTNYISSYNQGQSGSSKKP